jgi:hypothetical protein
MSDELKSAWEIALEKMGSQAEAGIAELSEEQKEAIAETRRKYKAKIAEAEINSMSRIRGALESGQVDQVRVVQEELSLERKKLEDRMELKVESIRAGKSD